MRRSVGRQMGSLLLVSLAGSGLTGCNPFKAADTTGSIAPTRHAKVVKAPTRADRECLARAMYFESNRSSQDGMLAVGTVVMNRLDSPKYPGSVCEVVGQRKQFAPGVLSRAMRERDRERFEKVADLVLAGERHVGVGPALHFHTTGYTFKYTNMHYVADAGGNSFYEKSDREGYLPALIPHAVVQMAGGKLVPIQMAGLVDGASTPGTVTPTIPSIAATQLAFAPVLPVGVPTRYTSAPAN